MTTGYDSVNPGAIPVTAELIFPYNDGEPGTWTPADLARFPHATVQPITRRLGVKSYWGDVEPGCLWPVEQGAQAIASGDVTGLYVDLFNWPSLRSAMGNRIIPYWIAAYPSPTPTAPSIERDHPDWIPLGCVQWQYADPPGSGGDYDLTVTLTVPPSPIVNPGTGEPMITFGTIRLSQTSGEVELPAIFYPAQGTKYPVMLVQTGAATASSPAGTWEWFAMNDPAVTVNGVGTMPPVWTPS